MQPTLRMLHTALTAHVHYRFLWALRTGYEKLSTGCAEAGCHLALPWIPQVAMLAHPKVEIFVTHGGMNGVTEAIHTMTPMVCIPVFGDQPDNCARVAYHRLGVALDRRTLTPAHIVGALAQLQHAREAFQERIRQARRWDNPVHGRLRALEILETHAANPRPVLPLHVQEQWPWWKAMGLDLMLVALAMTLLPCCCCVLACRCAWPKLKKD